MRWVMLVQQTTVFCICGVLGVRMRDEVLRGKQRRRGRGGLEGVSASAN